MKAAVLVEHNKPLEIVDLDVPSLGVGQVLVKVECAGICGKQIDEITGRQPDPYLPHMLGHEGGGVVVDVGPGVRKVRSGDRVVLHWVKSTGIDAEAPRYYSHNLKGSLGNSISAGPCTTFSELTIVAENRVTKMPDDAPAHVCALMGCCVTTGLGIVFRQAKLMPGQSIAVFGAGGVGLSVIMAAKLVNAYPIVAIDQCVSKLVGPAMVAGATHTGRSAGRSICKDGFDVVVDTTGHAAVREAAYRVAHPKRGMVILAGLPHAGDTMTIDSWPLHNGRRIIGSQGGDTVPHEDIPRYYDLYARGILDLDALVTERHTFSYINVAVDRMKSGQVLCRAVIDF